MVYEFLLLTVEAIALTIAPLISIYVNLGRFRAIIGIYAVRLT